MEVINQKASSPRSAGRPFLRWAGGKQKLLRHLLPFVPSPKHYKIYYEPFFGGGSVFFGVQPVRAILSDVNSELINCYRRVAQHPYRVAEFLAHYARKNSRSFYLSIRDQICDHISVDERAARFIYLNKAAFNGIYRVNSSGRFNVPYGPSSSGLAIPSIEVLANAAQCLRRAEVLVGDFEDVVADAKKGDFVYLDPPYPPRSETACFTHYSHMRFNWDQQERVARVFHELANRGCLVMMSNADQKRIRRLYFGFNINWLNATRWLGSNGDRFGVREIIVTNFNVGALGTFKKKSVTTERTNKNQAKCHRGVS